MKKCKICGLEKDESEFHKDKSKKDGLRARCKVCENQRAKERYAIPEVKERQKIYAARPENKERAKEYDAEYRARPEVKERKKEYYAIPEVKERKKQYNAERYARPEVKERQKICAARPENKIKRNQRVKKRCQIDSCYKLRKCISRSVRKGLKKNYGSKRGSSILEKLPYSMQELKQHIESLWESWMNWGNHGKYEEGKKKWHIDHITPQSKLPYDSMNHPNFRQCWSLSNLRPLEAIANIKKGNK